jgi:SAM-dependent methyltransferase/NAD(P)-dependent dehydrogenase (short-subunit alcohol dehydrogenase family)/acyl carrier protein
LPTYPFERRSYWVGELAEDTVAISQESRDTSSWFHRPAWRTAALTSEVGDSFSSRRILVFDEQAGPGAAVIDRLRALGGQPIIVRQGDAFECLAEDEYVLDPSQPDGYRQLTAQVCVDDNHLAGVIDCWSASPPNATDLDTAAVVTLLNPMRLARSLSSHTTVRPLPMLLVACGTSRVHDDDVLDPARALGIGPAKVLPQEHPGLRVAHIDVDADPAVADLLLAELAAGASEPTVALRGGHRFVEIFEPVPIDSVNALHGLPENPVVLITGGMGYMGLLLGEAMFERMNARLILISRTALPEPNQWAALSEEPSTEPELRDNLERLARMRDERNDVLVLAADLNEAGQVAAAVNDAMAHFGHIDLVVHGAARVDAAAFGSAAETGPAIVEAQMSPKLRGLFYLIEAFRGREPQRWVLHSSISTVLGGLGLAAYAASNAVLDAIALEGRDNWLSIDWDAWDNAGEALSAGMPTAIQPLEGQEAFLRTLGAPVGSRLLVVVNELADRLQDWIRHDDVRSKNGSEVERHPRPNLTTAFVEPRTETEQKLSEIWSAQLGVTAVGVHDGFFDLGGHSLLAVQVSSQIQDQFQIEIPVLKLFQAPTVSELAVLVDQALASGNSDGKPSGSPAEAPSLPSVPALEDDTPGAAAKASYRDFYDDVTRRLERSGVGEASFFLNYGYISLGDEDEACCDVPKGTFNPSSVRLALELIGTTDLKGQRVLDVGCGRGGAVVLMDELFEANVAGVDLAPEAVAFCRRTHQHAAARFEVGDAENLPFDDDSFDVVTNIESSHTYPNLRSFYAEVRRVLVSDGWFLYTDLLPVERWAEVLALLGPLGFTIVNNRNITPNVLASCDAVAATRAQAFGETSAMIENFLAVPGSMVYEQMNSRAWQYRILRARQA